jgi:tripartite ATP-independent transporter DctP family solute receptor
MQHPRILAVLTLAVAVALGGLSGAAGAGEKTTLKIGHVLDTKHPYHVGAEAFAKRLRELSGERIDVQVYPSSQLGNEREMVEAIQFGTMEAGGITSAVVSRFVKELDIFNLPFLFRDFNHVYSVLDSPFGEELNQAAQKKGIRILGFWVGGTRSVYARKPIGDLASLKGLKIRTMETPMLIATWKAMGTIPTPIPFSEVYTSIQQGVVDGGEGNVISYVSMKFDEVAPHLSHIKYLNTITPLILGEKFFQGQPPDLQKAILQAGKESVAVERKANEADEQKVVDALRSKGRTVVIPDIAPFQKAVESIYEQYGKTIGMEKIRWIQNYR